MPKQTIIQFCVICLFFYSCEYQKGPSIEPTESAYQSIDSLLSVNFQKDIFHGGVVISENGKVVYEKYFGLANRSFYSPITAETKFDIASVNKSMIAALILKSVEEGKLSLEDKLIDLLAGFSYEGSFNPEINLHHLLSHTSGLCDYDGVSMALKKDNFLALKRLRFTPEEYVNFISQLEPIDKPAQRFHYSNFAYHLLAIVLEKTYNTSFERVLDQNLCKPLGLNNTLSKNRNEAIIDGLADAYLFNEKTDQWENSPYVDLSLSRRVFSTVSDLNRWGLVISKSGYLSQASLDLMQKNHLKALESSISYGYGWVVVDEDNPSSMGNLEIEKPYIIHGGSTDGFKSMLVNINRGEYVISMLSNSGNRTQEMQLTQKIVKHLNLTNHE